MVEIFLLFLFNQQALAAEVIKTIRDIISLNPLYKEFLAQLIEGGKRVADNPVHLADFGKQQTKPFTTKKRLIKNSCKKYESLLHFSFSFFFILFPRNRLN